MMTTLVIVIPILASQGTSPTVPEEMTIGRTVTISILPASEVSREVRQKERLMAALDRKRRASPRPVRKLTRVGLPPSVVPRVIRSKARTAFRPSKMVRWERKARSLS